MNPYGVLIVGTVALIAFAWQAALFKKIGENQEARRLLFLPPAIIAPIVFWGITIYGIFLLMDSTRSDFGVGAFIGMVFFAIVFSALLYLKTIFAPLVNGMICCYAIYKYFEHGTLSLWPFMRWIVSLVVYSAGDMAVAIYTVLFMFGSLLCGGLASMVQE